MTGVSFKEAVSYLETGDFEQVKLIEETYQPFQYYLHEEPFQQARTYLQVVRGLSDQTINTFGRQGLLAHATYQSEPVLVLKAMTTTGPYRPQAFKVSSKMKKNTIEVISKKS